MWPFSCDSLPLWGSNDSSTIESSETSGNIFGMSTYKILIYEYLTFYIQTFDIEIISLQLLEPAI